MDEGRFPISADFTYQRIGAGQRYRTADRPVIVCCVDGLEVDQGATETLRGLGSDPRYGAFGARLLLHLVGAVG
jgi:hypothetical protein